MIYEQFLPLLEKNASVRYFEKHGLPKGSSGQDSEKVNAAREYIQSKVDANKSGKVAAVKHAHARSIRNGKYGSVGPYEKLWANSEERVGRRAIAQGGAQAANASQHLQNMNNRVSAQSNRKPPFKFAGLTPQSKRKLAIYGTAGAAAGLAGYGLYKHYKKKKQEKQAAAEKESAKK